jgi:hypothetical protein
MADEHRHPDAGGSELDLRIEDLLGLGRHLPLFARIARIHKHVYMRYDVEGDLLGELFRLRRIGDEDALRLIPQLVHRFLAGSRHRLIGRHHDPLDASKVMQRL